MPGGSSGSTKGALLSCWLFVGIDFGVCGFSVCSDVFCFLSGSFLASHVLLFHVDSFSNEYYASFEVILIRVVRCHDEVDIQ